MMGSRCGGVRRAQLAGLHWIPSLSSPHAAAESDECNESGAAADPGRAHLPPSPHHARIQHMPVRGKLWRHVIINTRGTWLHGDPRGFRSRRHRIHSSGDYKHPPPKGEHEGLYDYQLEQSKGEVHIPFALRSTVGRAIVEYLRLEGHRTLAVAVTSVHAHMLVELPEPLAKVKSIIGHAKRKSSRAVKKDIPGAVWGRGGTFKRVLTPSHSKKVFGYILYDQGSSAWTCSFADESIEGMYGRRRPETP
jgi:hypothetical protein